MDECFETLGISDIWTAKVNNGLLDLCGSFNEIFGLACQIQSLWFSSASKLVNSFWLINLNIYLVFA